MLTLVWSNAPARQILLPPTVTWVATPRFALGEPVFVKYRITNPNDEPITLLLEPSRKDWFHVRLESDAPLAGARPGSIAASLCPAPSGPAGGQAVDQLHTSPTQVVGAHGVYENVSFVWPPASASLIGSYRLVFDSNLIFRAGNSDLSQTLPTDLRTHIEGILPVEVVAATDAEISSYAEMLGSEYDHDTYRIAPGIDKPCFWFLDAWLNMPVAASLPVWRRHLLGSGNEILILRAARVLAQRSDPEVKRLLRDMQAYIHEHRPDLDQAMKLALRKEQRGHD